MTTTAPRAAVPPAARLWPADPAGLASIGLRTRKLRAGLSALGIAIGVDHASAAAASKTILSSTTTGSAPHEDVPRVSGPAHQPRLLLALQRQFSQGCPRNTRLRHRSRSLGHHQRAPDLPPAAPCQGAPASSYYRVLRQSGVQVMSGSAAWPGPGMSRRAGGLPAVVLPGGGVTVSGRGLDLPRQLPFERWLAVGRQLSTVSSSAAWCLGDWLVYGQRAYEGRYRQAVEQTSLDYQTLRNYAWVAGRFALSRRRQGLSFGHHAEVAALAEPEQDFWLRKAEELGWPVKQLRQQVRASLAERAAGHGETATPGAAGRDLVVVRLALRIPAGQLQACQEAADKASLSIEAWTIQALEHAARRQLDPAPTRRPRK